MARPIASGTISFGLVSIPVKLFSTNESSARIQLNSIHETCGTRVRQQFWCPTDEVVVSRDEMVKGYQFAKDQYVLFDPDELKRMELAPTQSIDIKEFVPLEKVDPLYFDKGYYLGPDKGGDKPYRLLSQVMRETSRAGLARYAARGKDYLVLLRPFEDGILMQQLKYNDEIRSFEDVEVPDTVVDDQELALATQLVEQIASDEFTPENYHDGVKEQMLAAIAQKVEGQEMTFAPQEEPKAQVIDLMEALNASLGDSADSADTKKTKKAPSKAKKKRAQSSK
ncbi:MAG: Ku protein [Acidimicrobiia bacterium]